ncbi:unnamed protein product, partial [Ilex paraguariensis]
GDLVPPSANVAPTPTDATPVPSSVGTMPAPQGYASTVPADGTPLSRRANSFSTSIDELFGDIGGSIGSEVIRPP